MGRGSGQVGGGLAGCAWVWSGGWVGEVIFQSVDRHIHECYWFLSRQRHLDGRLRDHQKLQVPFALAQLPHQLDLTSVHLLFPSLARSHRLDVCTKTGRHNWHPTSVSMTDIHHPETSTKSHLSIPASNLFTFPFFTVIIFRQKLV